MIGDTHKARIIFLGDATIGTKEKIEENEIGLANLTYTPYKPRSLLKVILCAKPEPITIRNIPYDLMTFKPYIPHGNIPKGGVFLINTASCGRNFLRNELLKPFNLQKLVLNLKKEIDMINSGLIDLPYKVKTLMEKKLIKKFIANLETTTIELKKLRKSMFIKKTQIEVKA